MPYLIIALPNSTAWFSCDLDFQSLSVSIICAIALSNSLADHLSETTISYGHSGFLEHWNSQKSLCNIWQRFSCLLDEWIEKICKKNFFHGGFFLKSTLSVLRCTWTGQINLKIFLGYHIKYLSIWPFMCHPWFPTKKASKLTFVCFQLQLSSPCNVFNTWCWKQPNFSLRPF